MSMGTALYQLPLAQLQAFDKARVVTDSDLADLRPHSHGVDQGLAYPMRDYPDVFAYILKAEGSIAHQHAEVTVGYVTPGKLRARLHEFEQLDAASIEKEISEVDSRCLDGLSADYLERHMNSLRQFLRGAVDQDLAVLIVQVY
jgi:hypothetical protein